MKDRLDSLDEKIRKGEPILETAIFTDLIRFFGMWKDIPPAYKESLRARPLIVSIGAGRGEDAALAIAANVIDEMPVQYFGTDILDYSKCETLTQRLESFFAQDMASITVYPKRGLKRGFGKQGIDFSSFRINSATWDDILKPKILEKYGIDYDATKPEFWNNITKQIPDSPGMVVLRHPDISDPELTETFRTIIINMIMYGIENDVPILITTATTQTSRILIHYAIQDGLKEAGYAEAAGEPKRIKIYTGGNSRREIAFKEEDDPNYGRILPGRIYLKNGGILPVEVIDRYLFLLYPVK